MDPKSEKQRFRAEMKAQRAALSHRAVRDAAYAGANALFSPRLMNLFSRFRGFASYMSIGNEVPTDWIHHVRYRMIGVTSWERNGKAYKWFIRGVILYGSFDDFSRFI